MKKKRKYEINAEALDEFRGAWDEFKEQLSESPGVYSGPFMVYESLFDHLLDELETYAVDDEGDEEDDDAVEAAEGE